MKTGAKIAIGCGVTALVCFFCVASLVVWIGYKTKDFVGTAYSVGTSIEAIDATNDQFPFTAPDDFTINPNRYDDYLEIRDAMLDQFAAAGVEADILEQRVTFDKLTYVDSEVEQGVGEMITLGMKMAHPIGHNKIAARVLMDHQMSQQEYLYYLGATLLAINSMAVEDPMMEQLLHDTLVEVERLDYSVETPDDEPDGDQVTLLELELSGTESSIPQKTKDVVRQAIERGTLTSDNLGDETATFSVITPTGIFNVIRTRIDDPNFDFQRNSKLRSQNKL